MGNTRDFYVIRERLTFFSEEMGGEVHGSFRKKSSSSLL